MISEHLLINRLIDRINGLVPRSGNFIAYALVSNLFGVQSNFISFIILMEFGWVPKWFDTLELCKIQPFQYDSRSASRLGTFSWHNLFKHSNIKGKVYWHCKSNFSYIMFGISNIKLTQWKTNSTVGANLNFPFSIFFSKLLNICPF